MIKCKPHCNKEHCTYEIQYYQKKTGQEIDFIFNNTMAVEVKETAIEQDGQVLKQRASAKNYKS